jgi:hypothetical protein
MQAEKKGRNVSRKSKTGRREKEDSQGKAGKVR